MKSSELIRLVKKEGCIEIRQTGSHKIFLNPATQKTAPIPFHGSKEIGKGLIEKIFKQLGLE